MKVTSEKEISLDNFEAWGSGADTLKVLNEKGLCDTVEDIVNDIYPDGLSDTTLNDFLAFDKDAIAEWCGYIDWDYLLNS